MKKVKLLSLLTLLLTLFFSCSSDDETGTAKEFLFLNFKQDVSLPNINPTEMSIFGIDFDRNKGNWEINITDSKGKKIPTTISFIGNSACGWVDSSGNSEKTISQMNFTIPILQEGDYNLVLKNKITSQVYKDIFKVRSQLFKKVEYNYNSGINYDNICPIENTNGGSQFDGNNIFYFQNLKYRISNINLNGIVSLNLQNKISKEEVGLDFSLENSNLIFSIPESVSAGRYFLYLKYNNLLENHHTKEVIVLEKQTPTISSLNKKVYNIGETIKIKGNNLAYKIPPNIYPLENYRKTKFNQVLFKDKSGNTVSQSYSWNNSNDVSHSTNSENTEISVPLKGSIEQALKIQNTGYFEGKIVVINGGYVSNSIPVRINF